MSKSVTSQLKFSVFLVESLSSNFLLMGRIRPAVMSWAVRVGCLLSLAKGAVSPGFNPLRRGWVYCLVPEAPLLGECRRSPRHFWKYWARVSYGPAPGPTLKKALCHTRPLGGTEDIYYIGHKSDTF